MFLNTSILRDTKINERHLKYVRHLTALAGAGDHCVLVSKPEDPALNTVTLCNAIGEEGIGCSAARCCGLFVELAGGGTLERGNKEGNVVFSLWFSVDRSHIQTLPPNPHHTTNERMYHVLTHLPRLPPGGPHAPDRAAAHLHDAHALCDGLARRRLPLALRRRRQQGLRGPAGEATVGGL